MRELDEKIIKLKRELYFLLLEREPDQYTDVEVNIMYELSKDKDVQEVFKKKVGE